LGIINILGVSITKYLNNLITAAKLLPLLLFIAAGIFFLTSGKLPPAPPGTEAREDYIPAIILVFYAYCGFESLAVAAGEMENPRRNVPLSLLITMAVVSFVYILVQWVSIGVLGADLSENTAPIAEAAGRLAGSFGKFLVVAGTLVSIGGINIASSFVTPRCGVALSENGILPLFISRKCRFGTPYVAILISVIFTLPLIFTGSFVQLAAISAISRFVQYIPTSLSVLVFRKRNPKESYSFRIPFGPVVPLVSVLVSIWLLAFTALEVDSKTGARTGIEKMVWGLSGLLIGVPIYFFMKRLKNKNI
ncbi:MAG: amino acid permease, partial [Oligoflexales bacterium]|nr:amino acid permease [Oligoflexales bacterium]